MTVFLTFLFIAIFYGVLVLVKNAQQTAALRITDVARPPGTHGMLSFKMNDGHCVLLVFEGDTLFSTNCTCRGARAESVKGGFCCVHAKAIRQIHLENPSNLALLKSFLQADKPEGGGR